MDDSLKDVEIERLKQLNEILRIENLQLRCGWAYASASSQLRVVLASAKGEDMLDWDVTPVINFTRDSPIEINNKLNQRKGVIKGHTIPDSVKTR